jgi:hypothetical protein
MTGIYVTIRLDPFLQQFLRGYYECNEVVFSFPRQSSKCWLPLALKTALWFPPLNFKPQTYGEETFRIEIPEMKDKDPDYHNHISDRANMEFCRSVRSFYNSVVYSFFDEAKHAKYGAKSIVSMFIDRYQIDAIYEDRVARDYSRYNLNLRVKKFRFKNKKLPISLHENN